VYYGVNYSHIASFSFDRLNKWQAIFPAAGYLA